MNRNLLLTAAAVTALAAGATVPAAGAETAPAPKLEGAYAYVQHLAASNQNLLRVVFRTSAQLPRRFDGMIRAAGRIDGVGHSVSTARRGSTCYAVAGEIKRGRIAVIDRDGNVAHKRARLGTRFRFDFVLKDGTTQTRTVALRAARRGDAGGRPLGC